MVLFRVHLRAPPAIRDRVVKSLLRVVGPTRAIRGCIRCAAYVDAEDDTSIVYLEEWETPEAMENHLVSDDLKVLLSVIDLATWPPDVQFSWLSALGGIEVISLVRAGGQL